MIPVDPWALTMPMFFLWVAFFLASDERKVWRNRQKACVEWAWFVGFKSGLHVGSRIHGAKTFYKLEDNLPEGLTREFLQKNDPILRGEYKAGDLPIHNAGHGVQVVVLHPEKGGEA
jgi:hypothetical protein